MGLKAGDQLDGWTLSEELGHGGNAEVWRATHEQYGECALKVLSRRGGEPRQRFRDEVAVMERLDEHPGVLPLVASRLPAVGSGEPAWLATPVAEAVTDALGAEPTLGSVVDAVREYALALAGLVTLGIGHRDVKPGNLFRRDGLWLIGDFGLATYPEKEAVTSGERRLGPLYFMAPEMLRHPDQATAEPADVYSLAKTLWVLASGQHYPPEGQIRVDLADHDLGRWSEAKGTLALSLILEGATAEDPEQRGTMQQLADALAAWQRGGNTLDDTAAAQIRGRYLERLGDSLRPPVAGLLRPGFVEFFVLAVLQMCAVYGSLGGC